MLDLQRIGDYIAGRRREIGLTQQQVAAALCVTFQAVSKWESGNACPGIESLAGLARLYGISIEEILEGRHTETAALTYSKAGVDIDYTDSIKKEFAGLIGGHPRVLNGLGPFASLYDVSFPGMSRPVLVLKAEEPGSKQKLAFAHGYVHSVCHDMINHLVNDIAVMGARPLAVLDTIVCGKPERDTVTAIVRGIAEACAANRCVLVGGETSVQPGVVEDYVLTACAAGIADRTDIIDGSAIRAGDVVLAVASNGPHSNGYTLIRKLMEAVPAIRRERVGGVPFLEAVMVPHTAYYPVIEEFFGEGIVRGAAHITGGGIAGNTARVIPRGLCARIDLSGIHPLPIFDILRAYGNIPDEEMLRTFNCGAGLILIVPEASSSSVIERIGARHACYPIGSIEEGGDPVALDGAVRWR